MKRILLSLLILMSATPAFALTSPTEDILKIGVGARCMGMGKAYVAVADDINSIFLNPAGMSSVSRFQFTSMYTSLFEGDLNYILFAVAQPSEIGTVGFGVISTGTSQIPIPGPTTISYSDYFDRLYIMSLSPRMPIIVFDGLLYSGINFKYFSKGFTDTIKATGQGLSADIGFKYYQRNELSFGLNIQNVIPNYVNWSTGAKDEIPMLVKAGVSKKFMDEKLILAADIDVSPGRNLPSPLHVGGEYRLNKFFSLRGGVDQSVSASTGVSSNLTAGVGINFGGLRIDYAYHNYSDASVGIAHFVSLTI